VYDDESMLERLARALAPPAAQPSWNEVEAVRRATAFVRQRLAYQRARLNASARVIVLPTMARPASSSTNPPNEARQPTRVRYADIRFLR
jgi:hypothetical protein